MLDPRGAPVKGGEEPRKGVEGEELRKGVSLASLVSRGRSEVVGDRGRVGGHHVAAPRLHLRGWVTTVVPLIAMLPPPSLSEGEGDHDHAVSHRMSSRTCTTFRYLR